MVTANALQRTFHLAYGDVRGTCFTVDLDGRQYIVTAKHIVPEATGAIDIQVHHETTWKTLPCRVVGAGAGGVDILVLAPPWPISPALQLTPTGDDLYLGQDVYFLGFPYGLQAQVGEMNADFPIPLVKRACVSMFSLLHGTEKYLLLDGHNNPGFSGGPVVFAPSDNYRELRVAGVVSGYRFDWDKVYSDNAETSLSYKYNTGIVIAYSISHAVELVYANPIGALIDGDA